MHPRKLDEPSRPFGSGFHQSDDVPIALEDVVDLGPERSSREFRDLPEMASDLVPPPVFPCDAGPSGDVEDEIVGQEAEVCVQVAAGLRLVRAPDEFPLRIRRHGRPFRGFHHHEGDGPPTGLAPGPPCSRFCHGRGDPVPPVEVSRYML